MTELTPDQKIYLQGLRDGDVEGSELVFREEGISDPANRDLDNFRRFLVDHGHPNPQPADLGLTVTREAFLAILRYADERHCLILQNCFGFDKPPVFVDIEPIDAPPREPIRQLKEVGRVLLIEKGNFQEKEGRNDEDFFGEDSDTLYRNEQGDLELYRDMDLNQPLSSEAAQEYTDNFTSLYPEERQNLMDNPFILGYLFPVKAMLRLLTDSTYEFDSADEFTFRWGVTRYNKIGNGINLGNFTLVIGIGDVTTGPVIEFRNDAIKGTGANDCPPNTGCPKPKGRG